MDKNKKIKKKLSVMPIPEDWDVVKLGEVVEIYDHKRIPLSEMERSKRKGNYPYCGANGVIDFIDDYIFDGEYVLLAEDGGDYVRFGRSAYIMSGKFWVNNHAHVLKALESKLNNWFLMYLLNFLDLSPYIVGSTRTKLNQDQMRNIKLPIPPLPEQKRIAEVLRTIDEAIEKVEQEIEHTERLKKGLMQHLLTRGIGHTRFKDSILGKIPESWEVVRLGDCTTPIDQMNPSNRDWFWYIDISSIDNDAHKIVSPQMISGKSAPSRARKLVCAGDVIFSTTRPYLKNIAIVPTELDGQICSTGFCVLRAKRGKVLPEWIYYIVVTDRFIRRIESKMRGATYPAVSDKDVYSEKIPLPPLPEQKKIAEILMTVDRKIELLKNKKEHLERLKKGLMNDLLTGRRRVKL